MSSRAGSDSPGQRGLIDLDRVAVEQARVGGHDVAEAHPDDVARHQLARRRGDPLPVALDPRLDRQLRLQRRDRLARLVLLPEPHAGVGDQQDAG